MKILRWITQHSLLLITVFLLAFIPLYPKLPLLDVKNTWIYIRIEDFLVAVGLGIWLIQLIRKKAYVKTPLTIPILIYWGIGLLSLIYALVVIFPHLANVFPNVAVLYLLRHVEYLSVFFIAYSAIQHKKDLNYILSVLVVTLLAVCLYGYGQKGFLIGWDHRFPAYSTMSEEFSKGIPLLLSVAGRVQSTFAGHYDLAAYLILLIPLMASMIVGVKKIWLKVVYFVAWIAGLVLLLMTASRVSFAVYLVSIAIVFFIQKQKKFIIPVILGSILLLNFFQGISQRFAGTISSVDTVIDARTGKVVGTIENTPDGQGKQVVIKQETPTGEKLPVSQSGIINLPTNQKEEKKITSVQIERKKLVNGQESTEVTNIEGNFVIKRTLAYDLSFTTRFQGEWPRAMEAFNRNILTGSGYSSINAATDNNYLRIIGETGMLGFFSFGLIFLILGIYTYQVLPEVHESTPRSFILGCIAGLIGLGLNAILIDVFEASKVAFVMWLMIGAMLGVLHLYQKHSIDYRRNLINVFTSAPAILIYLLGSGFAIFSMMFDNYFVGDDFTWLRWVADCRKVMQGTSMVCESTKSAFFHYFTNADGFFYRPGMKIYFSLLYPFAWLNASPYHVVSLLLHIAVSWLVYLLAHTIFKQRGYAFVTAFLFLVLSSHSETIFWISSVGHLFAAFFTLSALLLHIYWREQKRWIYLALSLGAIVAAPLFQETGVVAAFLVILYDVFVLQPNLKNITSRWYYLVEFLPLPIYLVVRSMAKSHWSGGDYSYNLMKLPFNVVGNLLGYVGLAILGSNFIPFYTQVRESAKSNWLLGVVLVVLVLGIGLLLFRLLRKRVRQEHHRILTAGILLTILPLLPVLPLGNIALRYVYLSSIGIVLLLVFGCYLVYTYVAKTNRYAAITATGILLVGFSFYHIVELQRINHDWKSAGKITDDLLEDISYTFPGQKATPPNPVFYFVNTPIKYGEAWVFPVGLSDALWFSFQNENLTVHTANNLQVALDTAEGSTSARVFEFTKDGSVEQVRRVEDFTPKAK